MNKTRTIKWFEPVLDDSDIKAVVSALEDGYVNEGPRTRAFEEALAGFFGVEHATATPNCTTALALTMMALGVGRGDTVLVPDLTFIGTASAVRLAGAEPLLVDIDPSTFTMDPEHAARQIRETTKAIVPVHLNGRPADLANLRDLAQKHSLSLIEDAAEAMGSENTEGYLGTQSDAGCFSLAPTKTITSGQGGFVLTDRKDVRDNLTRLKDHGRLSRASDEHPATGFNFKFTDLQAALAMSQFKKLPARMQRRLDIEEMYREGLDDITGIQFPVRSGKGIRLMWPDFVSDSRDALVAHLGDKGITVRPFWPPLHTQPAYKNTGGFPNASEACERGCWLPCSPDIAVSEVEAIVAEIRNYFAQHTG